VKRLNLGGFTAAGVLVVALIGGAVGGAVAMSSSSTPAPAPVTVHQVADEDETAPEPTATSTPTPAAASIPPADAPEPTTNTAPAAVAVDGETAAEAADRAAREADRAEDAADRAESTIAAPKPTTKATETEEPVHSCPSGAHWYADSESGLPGQQPGCVGDECPAGQHIELTGTGSPYCEADPKPAVVTCKTATGTAFEGATRMHRETRVVWHDLPDGGKEGNTKWGTVEETCTNGKWADTGEWVQDPAPTVPPATDPADPVGPVTPAS
jgi:hypothetical protein